MIVCSICVFTGPRDGTGDGADPDDHIVIVNGQSACVDHINVVGGNGGERHRMIAAEVSLRGFATLGALQAANAAARRARELEAGATDPQPF